MNYRVATVQAQPLKGPRDVIASYIQRQPPVACIATGGYPAPAFTRGLTRWQPSLLHRLRADCVHTRIHLHCIGRVGSRNWMTCATPKTLRHSFLESHEYSTKRSVVSSNGLAERASHYLVSFFSSPVDTDLAPPPFGMFRYCF